MKSIQKEDIDVLKYCPILVDEEYRILDGQHRFYVSKKLGRPVFFIQIANMDIQGVAKINSNSSNWRIKDFLNTYVDLKKLAYKEIHSFIENGYKMPPLYIASLLHYGVVNSKDIKQIFIEGLLECNFHKETSRFLSQLKEYEPYTKKPYTRRFASALEKLNKAGKFDQKHMIKKLKESGGFIDRVDTPKNIISQLEEFYNYRMRERRYII